jgi:hypothetical protein
MQIKSDKCSEISTNMMLLWHWHYSISKCYKIADVIYLSRKRGTCILMLATCTSWFSNSKTYRNFKLSGITILSIRKCILALIKR